MKSTALSKLIVLIMVAAIGVFAWRKLTTIPPQAEVGLKPQPAHAADPPPSPSVSAGRGPEQQAPAAPAAIDPLPAVDHGAFDALLRGFVRGGRVDYAGLKPRAAALDDYLQTLSSVQREPLGHDELLALYINAYNAATLRLVLEHFPGIASIHDIPENQRWKDSRWTIAGEKLSLDDIEHTVLRKRFNEPRIHFAIVCASKGCPPLRNEAYVAQSLEQQLDDQARQVHRDPRYLQWDESSRTLRLTPLYDWFKEDFTRGGLSVADFVAAYCEPAVAESLGRDPGNVRLTSLDWDWSLNSQ